jgi:hypothetical protein
MVRWLSKILAGPPSASQIVWLIASKLPHQGKDDVGVGAVVVLS